MEKELWYYCEEKLWYGTRPMLCLISENAVSVKKLGQSEKNRILLEKSPLVKAADFLKDPTVKNYSKANAEEFYFFTHFDEREVDIAHVSSGRQFAGLSFCEKETGRRITMYVRTDEPEALRARLDSIFGEEKKDLTAGQA